MRSSRIVLTAFALVACKRPSEPTAVPGAAGPGPAAPAGAAAGQETIKGKVLERVDPAPYSYIKLSTPDGEKWAAVPQTNTAVGAEVTVQVSMPMKDFESKTINRKFDVVYFGTLSSGGAPAPLAA